MIHTVVRNVVREDGEGQRTVGNVHLTGLADIELLIDSKDSMFQPVDVRGYIDRNHSRVDNIYGCLKIAQEIEDVLRNGKDPIVYCDGGLERSPLAVAVWLSWTHNIDLDFAYGMIKDNKPDIFRRDEWVEK